MKIIGSKVSHKFFGKGTVLALTDKIITVKFEKGEKDFEYPEAFEKFLTSDNKTVQTRALKLAEEARQRKEEEAKRRAEELRQKQQEALKARKSTTTKSTAASGHVERENAAFKCTYCDGGKTKSCIGFKGVCSKKNIEVNIKSGRNWCSRYACREYYDGEITRSELMEIYKEQGSVCYESRALSDWRFSAGWTEPKYDESGEIIEESKPKKMNNLMRGSLAVLTTRFPDSTEEERVIFAVFLVGDSYEGDDSEEGFVTADPAYKLAFTKEEAEQLLFWDFYTNLNSDKAHWGTGLFRYFTDEIAANILKRASEIKRGTKDEKPALAFFEHFCETHGIDGENLPECEGALKIKS